MAQQAGSSHPTVTMHWYKTNGTLLIKTAGQCTTWHEFTQCLIYDSLIIDIDNGCTPIRDKGHGVAHLNDDRTIRTRDMYSLRHRMYRTRKVSD
jgi:hypothetical protein